MAKETKMLKNEEAKKLGKPATKGLKAAETKKLPVSKTRAKKIKHSYKVKDAENALLLKLKDGDVVIEMYPDAAPNHVARIKELVRAGFYNGLKFHRVIDGFMAQTGCPYGNGTGGTGKKLKAEFNRNPHKRGTVSMARAMNPDSGDSQFFICFADCRGWTANIRSGAKLLRVWNLSTLSNAAKDKTARFMILMKLSA